MKMIVKNKSLKRLWQNHYIRHTIYWAVAYTLFLVNIVIWEPLPDAFTIASIVILPGIIPVYIHNYLHKRFFKRRQYLPYILSIIVVLIGAHFFAEGLIRIIENGSDTHTSGSATALFFIILTTALQYYKKGVTQQVRLQEAESKQLKTELALLKAQVNPHFFFNTLNNLYALSLDKSENVPDVILKISELMRYVLESSRNKEVELIKEIDFLKSYIALEKLRLDTHSDVRFSTAGDMNGKKVAPMLFIPFIENSFKHGISSTSGSNFIHIDLNLEGRDLYFTVNNNKPETIQAQHPSASKSGLKNVKRRLELLYPDRYRLNIENGKSKYKVSLKINL